MRPVIFPLLFSVTLAGCSLGTTNVTTGFTGSTDSASVKPGRTSGQSLARWRKSAKGKAASSRAKGRNSGTRVASLGSSPFASSRKSRRAAASAGFKSVSLNVEKARSLINDYRKSKGLKALSLDAQLTNAAKAHSRDLARWDRISHYGSDGSSPWDRVKRAGFNAKLAAENVGTGQGSVDEVFKGWQKSAGHNKNLLLADAENMGIALVHDPKTEFKTFWTLVIGTRL